MAAARTNAQIAEALAALTNIVVRDHQPGREVEMRLERFMKQKPPTFTGGYNPDGAYKWLEELEIIFEAMDCSEEGKTTLGTYVLREEANVWWKNAKLRLGPGGMAIPWAMFKREFLVKYFPVDVKNKKVVEFMELKQGNMTVADYAVKFETLCAFSPHYNTLEAENDKCVNSSGLRPDIKHMIGFSQIRHFATLRLIERLILATDVVTDLN
ncbi:unnamed protein product [Trifolium pratense]|uniref:Uncharacterized protein n=1 Tax=Trifolium pratense TaxID=57577 RepID=A0ACB0K3C2_TRIPR|nr:unnamed protein product [Trifolium pratense]